jgi:hypothetical protein
MEPRNFCPRCAIKHLAQARALLLESYKGYPLHVWYCIGHMAEAEDEIAVRMPDEAALIRAARLALEKDPRNACIEFAPLMLAVGKGGMLEEVEDA